MDLVTLLLALAGLALLVGGAELLVRGASRLAAAIGISPLVIGLTVVAYGTSAPELAVSINAGIAGQADIAAGNVVGSNIFNVLFILGLSAMISPLAVSRQLIRLDVPLMIGVSLLFLVLALDGTISRLEGGFLAAGLIAYTAWSIIQGRKEQAAVRENFEAHFVHPRSPGAGATALNLVFIVAGLAMLVLGSEWLVDGAVALAHTMGVSDAVIGLTIVAAGTSLPEVATSVMAALKGERDIAVGNVIGSSIFNILSVLGLSSLIAADGIHISSALLDAGLPVMVATALVCLPVFFTGQEISRAEGTLLFGYYIVYTLYLVFEATNREAAGMLSTVVLWFAIPLTSIALLAAVGQSVLRSRRGPGGGR